MKTSFAGAALGLLLILLSFAASAQNSARVRGTITVFDGKVLAVKSIEGQELKLQLANNTSVVYRQGDYARRPQTGGIRRHHFGA